MYRNIQNERPEDLEKVTTAFHIHGKASAKKERMNMTPNRRKKAFYTAAVNVSKLVYSITSLSI